MCGIFGIITSPHSPSSSKELLQWSNKLMALSESRGKEASGIMSVAPTDIYIYKKSISAKNLINAKAYQDIFKHREIHAIIGHTRLVTNGTSTNNKNNQPVSYGSIIGVHNGIITNESQLWKCVSPKQPHLSVDTEAVMALTNKMMPKIGLVAAIKKTYALLEGEATLAQFANHDNRLVLSTNTGSLYYVMIKPRKLLFFASEKYILVEFIKQSGIPVAPIIRISANNGLTINLDNLKLDTFSINDPNTTEAAVTSSARVFHDLSTYSQITIPTIKNQLQNLQKHIIDTDAIQKLKRCTKCILPETTPFITFDDVGVCNYCHQYEPITYKGKEALELLLAPYRSQNGNPDCLIGFSGGRDSSYGLHYLVKEMHMHPIAYTYDWGMLSDLGRQNAARVTGKLGVEHIVVSADIAKKHENIRKNILAWLKKPDIGLIPLFMAGDKQSEFYMNQLSKRTGIKLIVYCRGNRFEVEEFKAGHCGVKNADPGGVIHHLSWHGKLKMAAYYGQRFLANPRYWNSSLVDTMGAYVSTYLISHNYLFLWHYIPWDEAQIISILRNEYNWQTPSDTKATWRIDDASPAFYNYIYYQVQGFTEHDSLRSHQIREGIITRTEALNLVQQENMPRYESLQWYFNQLNLDGDEVLSKIDAIVPMYRRQKR